MVKKFKIIDAAERYFQAHSWLKKVFQLQRRVMMEEIDEDSNPTGNEFFCILTDHSALAEIKYGDTVEGSLTFAIDYENYQQRTFCKVLSINGKSL